MIHNNATPVIEVDAETYEVRADGELLTCEPADRAADGAALFPVLMRAEAVLPAGTWDAAAEMDPVAHRLRSTPSPPYPAAHGAGREVLLDLSQAVGCAKAMDCR